MAKKIIWEPWIDPLCHNIEKFYPKEVLEDDGKDKKEDGDDLYQDDHPPIPFVLDDVVPNIKDILKDQKIKRRFLTHPAGLIPVMDHHYLANTFNLWVGHTNFDITNTVKTKIELVEGVETLEIYSRYRFRVAFGKCFDAAEVKSKISGVLCDRPSNNLRDTVPEEFRQKVAEIKDSIQNKYWAVLLLPNGQTKVVTSDDNTSDFTNQLDELELLRKASNGVIYSYND